MAIQQMDIVIPQGWESMHERFHYAPAVRDGDRLWCSGILGVGEDGKVSADPREQFTRAFELTGMLLSAAGIGFAEVVEMTTFHVDLPTHLKAFVEVPDSYLRPPYPAWTAIGISDLARKGALVEIKVVARLP